MNRIAVRRGWVPATVVLAVTAAAPAAQAVSARWSYEAAYDNVAGGDWYRDSNNETATLAWGESYVMMSLAALFRGTGDPAYLERLARHIDGVLLQRDDARGVADYRGVSGACWRNTSYQPHGEAYCYAVHSGMIGYPLVEFARLVGLAGLREEAAPDGETFGAKADRYVAAARETVAFHDREWNASGYYVFPSDATFLSYAGRDQPLNQSNALGRLLLALHAVTGEAAFGDQAAALARRFQAQISTGSGGSYLWNYWGGAYDPYGEDISHAGINVGFAVLAASRGVVFDDADRDAFAATFAGNVYVDDATFSDFVGGGTRNDPSYRAQIGRWVVLEPARTTVYAAVRDAYERDYPPESIGSGSLLLGWAYLAEFEPPLCAHFFYYVDWETGDGFREATAYGANILTTPPDFAAACLVPLQVDVPRPTTVEQWDGAAYHRVATWQPTSGFVRRLVPYEPRWPHVYWSGGVLFQFADDFVAGDGILVREPAVLVPPAITSTPPAGGPPGVPLAYAPAGTGDPPFWWSLPGRPPGARIDAASGAIAWTPAVPGSYAFTLRLENDVGRAEQEFVYLVETPGADADADADAPGPDADAAEVVDSPDAADAGASEDATAPEGPPGDVGAGDPGGADIDVPPAEAGRDGGRDGGGGGDGDGGGCACRAGSGGSRGALFALLLPAFLALRTGRRQVRRRVFTVARRSAGGARR